MELNNLRPRSVAALAEQRARKSVADKATEKLPASGARSIADMVTGKATEGEGGPSSVRSLAETGARKAVAAYITPMGEAVLHRIGYRRVFTTALVLVACISLVFGAVIAAALTTAPAVIAPAAIAHKVLSSLGDLFGGGDDDEDGPSEADLSEAAAAIDCPIRNSAAPVAGSPAPVETTTAVSDPANPALGEPIPGETPAGVDPAATTTAGRPVNKIAINSDGSISEEDARALVDPVLPGLSSLRADVWFMYRLAGLGDYDSFSAAYQAAGLDDKDDSEDAVLTQIQTLNTGGIDMEPYRFTAAALTSAGQTSKRLTDPYPEFRRVISAELVSGCDDTEDAAEQRVTLPPASVTVQPPSAPMQTEPAN